MRASLSRSLLLFGNFLLENTSCGLRTMSPLMKPPFISQVREDRDQVKMQLSRKHGFTSSNNVIVMTSGARRAEGVLGRLSGEGGDYYFLLLSGGNSFCGKQIAGFAFQARPRT